MGWGYLLAPFISLVIAQSIKLFLERRHRPTVRQLYVSGGMPSAHAAVTVGLTTIVGLSDGMQSALFGIASVTTLIVIYDAMNVRYSVGEQAKLLSELVSANKTLQPGLIEPKIVRGHTISEVFVGSLIGVAVAFSIFFLQNS